MKHVRRQGDRRQLLRHLAMVQVARGPHVGPVDPFDGESDILFEDWMPGLLRAAEWNDWSEHETLIQLAGHLRGRALQV